MFSFACGAEMEVMTCLGHFLSKVSMILNFNCLRSDYREVIPGEGFPCLIFPITRLLGVIFPMDPK